MRVYFLSIIDKKLEDYDTYSGIYTKLRPEEVKAMKSDETCWLGGALKKEQSFGK